MPPDQTSVDPDAAPIEDEDYESSLDEDFNPDAQAHDSGASSSDDDADLSTTRKLQQGKKRRPDAAGKTEDAEADADGDDFENSGDEATIRKGRKRLKKGGGRDEFEDDNDAGGEGGLIKTRAQRAREAVERKPLADTSSATVDVDAVWASMLKSTPKPTPALSGTTTTLPAGHAETGKVTATDSAAVEAATHLPAIPSATATQPDTAPESHEEETVTIKRTYDFAGETITEEKVVPKSSKEATLYLASQRSAPPSHAGPLRKPKKRSSLFDPSLADPGLPKAPAKAKLNTIEKSKLDWAGFVDKAGIAEELDGHSRAKEGYLGRMDFLGRVEAKKEEELKSARKK